MKNKVRTFICVGCGKEVIKSCTKTVKFCSKGCYHKHGKTGRNKTGQIKTCINCGTTFYVTAHRIKTAITCSVKCSNEYQGRNKIILNCKVCGKCFKISPSFIKQNRKYCSKKCRYVDPDEKTRLFNMRVNQSKNTPNKFETNAYNMLKELNIDFIPQYQIDNKFIVDAFIKDKNTVIQFDGDYWHGNPVHNNTFDKRQRKRMALDISQDAFMKKQGIKVIRFWQSDFKDITKVKEKLLSL